MKKELKGFIIGVVTTLILTGGAFAANSIIAELYPDNVSIYSNGYRVIESNFTYNDKTYAPVREVAEKADCAVFYEEADKEVSVINRYQTDLGYKVKIDNSATSHKPIFYFAPDGSNTAYFDIAVFGDLGIYPDYDANTKTFTLINLFGSERAEQTPAPAKTNNTALYNAEYDFLYKTYKSNVSRLKDQAQREKNQIAENAIARGMYDSSFTTSSMNAVDKKYQSLIDDLTDEFDYNVEMLKIKHNIK